VEDLALHTVRTRLARFLLARADGKQPPKRWTQEEVAAQIGTVRDVVGRALRTFVADGLIRRERGRIVVVDRESLELEATGS
jgi:CRP/FNR family cyclic AMP-dependent transcriptional regulator